MANVEFKKTITKHFIEVVKYLKVSGRVKSKTEIGEIIGQPLQVISKLLSGERIITLEQMQMLIKNTNVNSYWFLTGERTMIDDDDHKMNEPSVDYQKTEGSTINTIGVLLPLISTLEEKIKTLEQNNSIILERLEAIVDQINTK
ncbi:hypothetical protein N9H73_05315 [Flavobacteriaceae bacterium]|nr:hypothetical protein [Flavobacteriaceae bacterium]